MTSKSRVISLEELNQHNSGQTLWIAIYDRVYDITKFAAEHPGGEEVLLDQAGKDGTAAFEDVGHSSDAIESMKQYQIGILDNNDKEVDRIKPSTSDSSIEEKGSSFASWLIPLGLAVLAFVFFRHHSSASGSSD